MFRKHLLPNLFQPTQISPELPESDGYTKNPDHSVADREHKEKKKSHTSKRQNKQMNKKIHSENRRGKKNR